MIILFFGIATVNAHALDRNLASVAVTTTAESTISSFTVTANILGVQRGARWVVWGTYTTIFANPTVTLRFKLAGTTVLTEVTPAFPGIVFAGSFWIDISIFSNSSTSAQKIVMTSQFQSGANIVRTVEIGTASANMASDVLADLTFQQSAVGFGSTLTKQGSVAFLE